MSSPHSSEISVVIPAHNEAPSIRKVLEGVKRQLPNAELVVVDDGSSDDTAEQARLCGAIVHSLKPNRGKGVALREGVKLTTQPILLFIDADGQDDPSEITRLLEALDEKTAMVIGSRFIGELHEGSITPLNYFGNRFLTHFFNLIFQSRISDTQAGFRIVRRNSVPWEKLAAVRYEIETEMTMKVLKGGGKVKEVPVSRYRREAGASGFRSFYHGFRILCWMISERLTA